EHLRRPRGQRARPDRAIGVAVQHEDERRQRPVLATLEIQPPPSRRPAAPSHRILSPIFWSLPEERIDPARSLVNYPDYLNILFSVLSVGFRPSGAGHGGGPRRPAPGWGRARRGGRGCRAARR